MKQEEEWLSSEELCTEGSSDEEVPYKTKLRIMPKKQEKSEKQDFLPFPQKTTTEALLSSISLSEITESNSMCTCESNKSVTNLVIGDASSAETLETNEFEILWRPKRGSLQLPSSSEGT